MAFNYPEPLEYLITALKQLPGVGRRGAERMALNMAQWDSEKLRELGALLMAIPQTLTSCPLCGAYAENGGVCPICSDPQRATDKLCIVETLSQLLAVENSGHYHGKYWVLGGRISPLDSENGSGLNISGLSQRIKNGGVEEVILALSSDVEGRATAWFIADLLKDCSVTISQPALGLPAGLISHLPMAQLLPLPLVEEEELIRKIIMGNNFVVSISEEQAEQLTSYLQDRGWEFGSAPYAKFRAKGDNVSLVLYQSGKLVVQGKGLEEFVSFVLEPEILHSFGFGYDLTAPLPAEVDPHGGIDESGKGDFFGPLVIGGVCVTPQSADKLRRLGVCDSKLIHSSAKIMSMAAEIRNIVIGCYTTVILMPETYNRLYQQIGNLNRLLAWGHARAIENLLEKVPDCPRMLSDKFGNETLIQRALMERGKKIRLDQAVRAESDVAVAAASILARDGFLRGMSKLQPQIGWELPRGAGPQVKEAGRRLLAQHGADIFRTCAKLHFKTYSELIGHH